MLLRTALMIGFTPDRFWRLSLKEWRALNAGADPVLTRAGLEALAQQFPDKR